MREDSDAALAAELATEAGRRLVALRIEFTGSPSALRDAGDRSSHEWLVAALAQRRPGDAVLSEEGVDDRRADRLAADRLWIVDPLDGTREYGETGRTDWAVHVALWERGELAAGAVALPARGLTLGTDPPPDPRPAPAAGRPPRIVVSRSRTPAFATALAERVGAELVTLGSAGAKAMAVVLGEADAYLHTGAMHEWDAAAPAAVAAAAGLHVSRLDGGPLAFNTERTIVAQLLVAVPALAERILAAAAELVPPAR